MSLRMLRFALPLALAACQPGQTPQPVQFTLDDVTTAQALATAGGDPTGAACWGALLPVASAVQQGKAIGAAVAIELYRVAVQQAQGPCAPIVLPILIRLGPVLGLAGGLAAAPTVLPLLTPVP